MKRVSMCFSILVVPVLILFNSCVGGNRNSVKLSDFTPKHFILQDSLAEIEIYLPNELDTFFESKHVDDNLCDDLRKYCFVNKKFFPDSSYSLTVHHIDNYHCKSHSHKVDSNELFKYIRWLNKFGEVGDSAKLISAEISNYNGKDFIVMSYTTVESGGKGSFVKAHTLIDSVVLGFQYFTNTTQQATFIERMKKSLSTVKIKVR